MALTNSRCIEIATACTGLASRLADLYADVRQFLDLNSDQAIDWAAAETPAYIDEDANGNMQGQFYTRQHVANAIGSLDNFRKLLGNESAAQGDHLGNINQLVKP